jgi:hypothetical protein
MITYGHLSATSAGTFEEIAARETSVEMAGADLGSDARTGERWFRFCRTKGEDSMKQPLNLFSVIMLIGIATPALGQNVSESDLKGAHDLQSKFVAAFNRQDAVGVAALFTEDGIRVTPQGIIKGRDAIWVDLESRFKKNFRGATALRRVAA